MKYKQGRRQGIFMGGGGGKRVRTSEKLGVRGLPPQNLISFDPLVNCIEVIVVNFFDFVIFPSFSPSFLLSLSFSFFFK